MAQSLQKMITNLYKGPFSECVGIITGFDEPYDELEDAMGGNSFLIFIAPEIAQKMADICEQIPDGIRNISISIPYPGFSMRTVSVAHPDHCIFDMESEFNEEILRTLTLRGYEINIKLSPEFITFSRVLETDNRDYEASISFRPDGLLEIVQDAQHAKALKYEALEGNFNPNNTMNM